MYCIQLNHDHFVPGPSKLLILVYAYYRNICSACCHTVCPPIPLQVCRGTRQGKSQKGQKWIREDIILCDAVVLNLSGVPEISEPKQKFHETTFACSFAFQVEFFSFKKGSKISGHCPFK